MSALSAITLYAHTASKDFERKVQAATQLLRLAAQDFPPSTLTQASSLGAEDMVVTDLLQKTGVACSIFVLDTGLLHPETVALIDRLQTHYQRSVDVYQPDSTAAAAFVAHNGADAMYTSVDLRKACCDLRKMQPLAQALVGKAAWITGLRREQSNARAEVHAREQQAITVDNQGSQDSQASTRTKLNPLHDWTWGDVWHYIALHQVPHNPLHDQFYPSIGCAPCTRAVTLGENPRSGRWWWESASAKECGLHVDGLARPVTSDLARPNAVTALFSALPAQASTLPQKETL